MEAFRDGVRRSTQRNECSYLSSKYDIIKINVKRFSFRRYIMDAEISMIVKLLKQTPYFVCGYCFLRGSHARNNYEADSDIDILIVSEDFEKVSYRKRKELVKKAIEDISLKSDVDAICLSLREYLEVLNQEREMILDERMVRLL